MAVVLKYQPWGYYKSYVRGPQSLTTRMQIICTHKYPQRGHEPTVELNFISFPWLFIFTWGTNRRHSNSTRCAYEAISKTFQFPGHRGLWMKDKEQFDQAATKKSDRSGVPGNSQCNWENIPL